MNCELYRERACGATNSYGLLCPGKVGEALYELFRSMIGEADGELAVIVFAIHMDDGTEAVSRVAHALTDKGIAAAFGSSQRRDLRASALGTFLGCDRL